MKFFSFFFHFRPRYSLVYSRYYSMNQSVVTSKIHFNPSFRHLSTENQTVVSWETSSYATLLRKLEIIVEGEFSADEALEAFHSFRGLHGFPNHQLIKKMILHLACSADRQWIGKAYDLVRLILDEKPGLLCRDSLSSLALALARAQMPVPASTILRIILEYFKAPSTDTWNILFSHLVKTKIGSYVASEILIEICENAYHRNLDRRSLKQTNGVNPSVIMFNLVLNSCLRFGSLLKAQQIIELMPLVGVVADASTIVIIARIYEMVGQRDELKKLQGKIDAVSSPVLIRHYQQFYDSLLSLHFKFNDLDAAAELVLSLYSPRKPLHSYGLQKQCLFQIGSNNLRTGSKILVDPYELQENLVVDTQSQYGLVVFVDGKLVPTGKAFAKLISGYMREKKVNKLSSLLINICNVAGSNDSSLCSDVIGACIEAGWLESAHDILDDLEMAAIPVAIGTYESLLRAYCKENKLDEYKLLLEQMKKVGHFVNLSNENALLLEDHYHDGSSVSSDGNSNLVVLLDREIRAEGTAASSMVYEFNTSILFFCKAKMMDDALKTFKRMQERNIQPTVLTFSHLVNAYSSLMMYRQITILWGEIKRRLEDGLLTADRDLLDILLTNFLRGGYFERVMEIVNYMLKLNMFTDKWRYKKEFLKLHKDLYRSLKASDCRTDAQSKRLEHVLAFRRWAGIDKKS